MIDREILLSAQEMFETFKDRIDLSDGSIFGWQVSLENARRKGKGRKESGVCCLRVPKY